MSRARTVADILTTAATASSTTTFTNKTVNLTSNTISGTKAQFNTALSDDDFATLSGSETLTNKTLTSPTLTTPALGTPSALVLTNATGTPSSITLTNGTGLPVSGITASTSTALGVGSIELGHASDTTIARSSAGVVTIEGVNVVTTSSTDTLTNKTLTTPTITQGTATPTFTSNAYTLVSGDAGKLLLASNSSTAGTVNIPTDATFNFATGTQITILQTGSGQLTIQAASSGTTTVYSTGATSTTPKCRAQYSAITVIKSAANTWYAIGDIA